MIHLEQAGQPFRVLFPSFQAIDKPQQPFQQGMAAPKKPANMTPVLRRRRASSPACCSSRRSERARELAMITVASRTRIKMASAAPPVIIADRVAPRCRARA